MLVSFLPTECVVDVVNNQLSNKGIIILLQSQPYIS